MTGIVLTLRQALDAEVDLAHAFEGEWTSLPPGELAHRTVRRSGHDVPLGDLFDVHGTPDGTALLEGDMSRATHVASNLATGTVLVDGNVGDRAGQSMRGGILIVRGSAGERVGGAEPQNKRGMTGGEIVIFGHAGAAAGHAMRRGLLAVGGNCGAAAGFSVIAGTILVLGNLGADAGLLNRRGSLVVGGEVSLPPTYRYACEYQPHWLPVVLRRLRAIHGLPVSTEQLEAKYRRYSGDLAEVAKGEILVRRRT